MIEFKLPSLGADMDEGKLLEWHVAPGQQVAKGDVIAVVDTSKAAIDVEIWLNGTVHQLIAQVGETIPVGTVMATLLAPGESAPTAAPIAPPAAPPEAPPAPSPVAEPNQGLPAAAAPTRTRASPAARQRATELGVTLESLVGTGPEGAVTREDVERAAQRSTPEQPKDRSAEMRKAIAAAMSRSKREIPHYYLSQDVPMRNALNWLRAENVKRLVTARLLPAALLLKAVALGVRDVPEMNGVFEDGEFRPSAAAHIGVAIALRQGGLIAPALHDVGDKTLAEVMRSLTDLVKRCRAGSLRTSELSDPTITLTNLGDQGVDSVFGVIYPPQVALVGCGRINERPWVEDGRVVGIPAMTVSVAADHRVSDGRRGALFLERLSELLQQPDNL